MARNVRLFEGEKNAAVAVAIGDHPSAAVLRGWQGCSQLPAQTRKAAEKKRYGAALLLLLAPFSSLMAQAAPDAVSSPGPREITGVYVDVAQLHHDEKSNGDTWDYAWAADDTIYSFSCDGRGYGPPGGRNLTLNKLTGSQWDRLSGTQANRMDYGNAGAREPNGSNWKTTGADAIDGMLYAFVANNWYGSQNAYGGPEADPHIRQTVENMSLIKSADGGRTWERDAATNYLHPMWTSRKFSTAFFVKYGRDGGTTSQDDQDKYVYAISNDGYWNSGSHFYLGRVARNRIGKLDSADWEFFSDGQWSRSVEDATALAGFDNGQDKETMGSPIWLASLHKYVTVTWYDPGTTEKWHFPENVTFAFYQADHPWGPWSWIGEKSAGDFIADRHSRIHRWYGPSLSPRFITDNPDGSVTAILLFSGQTWEDTPASLYKKNSVPVTFYTDPQPREVQIENDTQARYSAGWTHEQDRGLGDLDNDVHLTQTRDAWAEFSFTGIGVELLAEKRSALGSLKIVLDGRPVGTVSLSQDPMPLLYQVPAYRNMHLAMGKHTLRVVDLSGRGSPVLVDGLHAYTAMDFNRHSGYRIVNRQTGRMLGLHDAAATTMLDRDAGSVPVWLIEPASGRTAKILRYSDHRALGDDALDGKAALLPTTAKEDEPSAFWDIRPVGNGTFAIINRSTGLSLTETVAGSSGSALGQLVYMGRDAQKWEIQKVANHADAVRNDSQ